jgi:hypothetical protein
MGPKEWCHAATKAGEDEADAGAEGDLLPCLRSMS